MTDMTNTELTQKIKAEIERRKDICSGVFERNSDIYYQGKAVAYDETLIFLSTLESEKQKEQKPAPISCGHENGTEWSEEDERILKGIIGKIDHDQTYGVSKAEMLSFLEGIRPSWKPSEEQMKALQCAIAFMEIRKSSDYDISPLKSFYEQLKKL